MPAGGQMTAALKTFADLLLEQPGIWRAQAYCAVENTASARVMEKAGMVRDGSLRRYAAFANVSPAPCDAHLYAEARD